MAHLATCQSHYPSRCWWWLLTVRAVINTMGAVVKCFGARPHTSCTTWACIAGMTPVLRGVEHIWCERERIWEGLEGLPNSGRGE